MNEVESYLHGEHPVGRSAEMVTFSPIILLDTRYLNSIGMNNISMSFRTGNELQHSDFEPHHELWSKVVLHVTLLMQLNVCFA